MKFELMFSTCREEKRLIFAGKGPHKPKDTNDNTFKFESFVITVKKESIEKLPESKEVLFPIIVNSVT
uniref:Uncharacterized protein n=1 Tax=Lotus japonicus TaxID=34305 RepID=I3SEG5_LOTJA|nr:unknown [Lotus japonicus]